MQSDQLYEGKIVWRGDENFSIIEDPTRAQMLSLFKKSEKHSHEGLRALVAHGHCWVWDAYGMTHDGARQVLSGLSDAIGIEIPNIHDITYTLWDVPKEDVRYEADRAHQEIKNCGALMRIFPDLPLIIELDDHNIPYDELIRSSLYEKNTVKISNNQLLSEGNIAYLTNLQQTCDNFGSGFYWEEGGCWGMALALADYFEKLGKKPHYMIQNDFVHCYVECEGTLYDYTGAIHYSPDCRRITRNRLISTARSNGVPASELMHDHQEATQIIRAATETKPLNEEVSTDLVLWHGGKDLQYDYQEVLPHDKGRWEYGPGLYLTNDRSIAERYAKGSRRLYRVMINLAGAHEMSDVEIALDDAIAFVQRNVKTKMRQQVIDDLRTTYERRGNKLYADTLVNLCLNWEAIANSKTNILRQFLIDHGVDYSHVDRYGGKTGSEVYVVMNPRIITKVEFANASR